MSYDEAIAFFQKEGYQSKETATMETKRGTGDPTYLYYTLGKLEIMKLREDMKKKQRARPFRSRSSTTTSSARGFHPSRLCARPMLGDQSPTL